MLIKCSINLSRKISGALVAGDIIIVSVSQIVIIKRYVMFVKSTKFLFLLTFLLLFIQNFAFAKKDNVDLCAKIEKKCDKIKIDRLYDFIFSDEQLNIVRAQRELKQARCYHRVAECRLNEAY